MQSQSIVTCNNGMCSLFWLQVRGVTEHVMDAAGGQRRTSVKAVSVRDFMLVKQLTLFKMASTCQHVNVQKVFSTFGHLTKCHFHKTFCVW